MKTEMRLVKLGLTSPPINPAEDQILNLLLATQEIILTELPATSYPKKLHPFINYVSNDFEPRYLEMTYLNLEKYVCSCVWLNE